MTREERKIAHEFMKELWKRDIDKADYDAQKYILLEKAIFEELGDKSVKKCIECKYFEDLGYIEQSRKWGLCKRYAPRPMNILCDSTVTKVRPETIWPRVFYYDFCCEGEIDERTTS